ncbi:hypothetical protein [Algoriphagus sediminis]|uniref:Uncharacterized protein n=1 Tax=Algoriphagus sediminis TaxID=3057113 RepID=A0ABT7Y8Z7_9BACT|nr:hypothetical protein [Algoriphagus sediminis]MDN3202986.1 hypothetical protein [Algoriphagus sediminis]
MSKKQFGNIGKFSKKNLNIKPINIQVTPSNRISNTQLKKLDANGIASIPGIATRRNELIRLPINESWEITPKKLIDKDMVVSEFYGRFTQTSIDVLPEPVFYRRLNAGVDGFLPELRYLVLSFRPEKGKRYRVRIKLKPGDYRNKEVMTSVTGRYNDKWIINDQFNEVLFDFIASTNQIKISPLLSGSRQYHDAWVALPIKQINVDKVED